MVDYLISFVRKFNNKIRTFRFIFKMSKSDEFFFKFSKKKWKQSPEKIIKGEILTDILFDDCHIFHLSYIANYFYINFDLVPKYFQIIHREKFLLRFTFSFFRKFTRLHKLYMSFGSDFAFGQTKYKKSKTLLASISFKSKRDLLNFEIDNIRIGDLIYDTYLRTYLTSTVDLSDKNLSIMMLNALDVYFSCKEYLDNHNVKKIILSHAVYINYGILARLAMERGIDVYNPLQERVLHKLSLEHPYPTPQHYKYPKIFSKFSVKDQDNYRIEAKKIIENRLKGTIDNGIFYMPQSPFNDNLSKNPIFLNNGKPKVVVMLHCFYDAPHIYKDMIFEDFHEWFDFILSKSEAMDVDLVIKPHPNGKPYNENIINGFQRKYPKIRYIDKYTSNKQIISEGVSALLSVYGSVATEFAYLGIPVLLAGDSPVEPYTFCYTAKNKEDYEHCLLNMSDIKEKINFSKSNIQEFFFLHYIYNHMGRIKGNNDIFNWISKYHRGSNNFLELLSEEKKGEFDHAFNAFDEALTQLDSN